MKFSNKLFTEPGREKLKKLIQTNIDRQLKQLTSLQTYLQPEEDLQYSLSIAGGQLVCYRYLHYLLIDPTYDKPWLAKQPVTEVLDKKKFIDYTDNIVKELNGRAPSKYYAGLVHLSTIINLLTNLEFTDG